ncbi:hypothetical protein L6R29_03465 [Myxococcota bacterium]|nr:hypothetical protein [Myxococcota bacterium]
MGFVERLPCSATNTANSKPPSKIARLDGICGALLTALALIVNCDKLEDCAIGWDLWSVAPHPTRDRWPLDPVLTV